MQINDSRLFKATRRTIRAELTLIIVIVISFSWSAYALYKLVVTNTDSSLFGINFSLASQGPAKQINSSAGSASPSREPSTATSDPQPALGSLDGKHPQQQQQLWTTSGLVTAPSITVPENLSEQLAIYKKQILKELLARQRRLLIDDGDPSTGPIGQKSVTTGPVRPSSLVAEPAPAISLSHYDSPIRALAYAQATGALVTENHDDDKLQQWRDGYNLPASSDYLFDNRHQRNNSSNNNHSHNDRLPLGSNNAHSVIKLHRNHQPSSVNNLVHLTGGPSLMQLNPTKSASSVAHFRSIGREPAMLSEPNLDNEEGDSVGRNHEDNLDDESARQPMSTTTEAPGLVPVLPSEENLAETTTMEPTLTTTMPTPTTTTDSPGVHQADQETASPMGGDTDATDSPAESTNGPEDREDDTDGKSFGHSKKSNQPAESEASDGRPDADESDNNNSNNDNDSEDDVASMERVKNTVHAIDEEVDRMTQPSLGMVSQQDKAFDLKNIVQFDDNLTGSSSAREMPRAKLPANSSNTATSNAHLTRSTDDHYRQQGDKKRRRGLRNQDGDTNSTGEPDLLVADDRTETPVSRADLGTQVTHVRPQRRLNNKLEFADRLSRVIKHDQFVNNNVETKILKLNASRRGGAESEGKLTNNKISQANQANRWSPNDGNLIRKRSKRSQETNLIEQTLDLIDAKSKRANEQKKKTKTKKEKNGNKKRTTKRKHNAGSTSHSRSSLRRLDDDDGNDDEEEEEDDNDENREEPVSGDGGVGEGASNAPNNYQYITSNDPSLQELLAHKQLLDALQQSKLPAPLGKHQPSAGSLDQQQQRLNSTFISPSASAAKVHRSASQPTHTHYTIDEGLLLTPASDEEHEHQSMAKKSGKSSEKKHKKKSTVAIKKGGHKKKKHKKEEKKYVKEKKFKGAKKGKKMAKGKGGKGGKKGKKYYKDKGFKKKGFKNIYVKNEFGQKKEYFDEFRDKDFKKKWKNFDDKYKYAQMKKWQAKDVKGAKKMKDHSDKFKKYDKGKWKKKYHKHQASESSKKKMKKYDEF